jgi:hypothetical protein
MKLTAQTTRIAASFEEAMNILSDWGREVVDRYQDPHQNAELYTAWNPRGNSWEFQLYYTKATPEFRDQTQANLLQEGRDLASKLGLPLEEGGTLASHQKDNPRSKRRSIPIFTIPIPLT